MNFISNSQAGQDLWVKAMLIDTGMVPRGTFLDIGANHPVELSNTYALEQQGWSGVLVDNDSVVMDLCTAARPKTPFWRIDATTFNWRGMLPAVMPMFKPVDYLSLDVDQATTATLRILLESDYRFRVATIEHDAYRFGPDPRAEQRAMMKAAGYELICSDVMSNGCEFEDWWVDPMLVDLEVARSFTCNQTNGLEIVSR